MSEENKAIVHRYINEAFNNRDNDIIAELISEGCIDHHIPAELPSGPEGIKLWFSGAFAAFPDCHISIQDTVCEDDKVVIRFKFSGTHQGIFMGQPATGKSFSITAMAIARIADGKIIEWWENADALSLMQQLEIIK
jgi:steroid delta-isomerase-like uncharacterized protein